MNLLLKYFPHLTKEQLDQYHAVAEALTDWNQKINVVSRKDIDRLEERHLLHSLGIAKFTQFAPGTRIIDIGTGGGFPGLPLAIFFPKCDFLLVDSIGKKIKVVNELKKAAGLTNVTAIQARAETVNERFDFVISRAVTALPKFYGWTRKLFLKENNNSIPNGIVYLKGGDLSQELAGFGKRITFEPLDQWFEEEWFKEKGVVYLQTVK